MRTLFKILILMAAAMAALSVFGGFALLHGHHGGDMNFTVNGEDVFFDGDLGDWLGASVGLFIAGVVVCIVVPLALLFSIALPLLIVAFVLGIGMLALLGVGAVLGSPLILLGLLLFVVLRNRRRSMLAKSGAL